jgi:hypothetical protein
MRANAVKTAVIFAAPVSCFVAGIMDVSYLPLVVAIAMTLGLWLTADAGNVIGHTATLTALSFGVATALIYLLGGDTFYEGLVWLTAALPAVLSRRNEAPAGAIALMLSGALVFSLGATMPTGPIGMTALLAGTAWLQMDVCEQDELRQVSLEATLA